MHIVVEGTCDGIPAGDVTLTVWFGKCIGFNTMGNCYFGWGGSQHILISETFVERVMV